MTSSSLEATTTRNYLLMSKMKKKLTENTVNVWPKEKKMVTGSLKAALGDCFS